MLCKYNSLYFTKLEFSSIVEMGQRKALAFPYQADAHTPTMGTGRGLPYRVAPTAIARLLPGRPRQDRAGFESKPRGCRLNGPQSCDTKNVAIQSPIENPGAKGGFYRQSKVTLNCRGIR